MTDDEALAELNRVFNEAFSPCKRYIDITAPMYVSEIIENEEGGCTVVIEFKENSATLYEDFFNILHGPLTYGLFCSLTQPNGFDFRSSLPGYSISYPS